MSKAPRKSESLPGSLAGAFAPSRLCSLFSNRHWKGRQEDIKVAVLFIFFPPFGSYLLSFLLTLQFQRFNDTIVSENDTEADTLCHLIGCPDEVKSAAFQFHFEGCENLERLGKITFTAIIKGKS